MDTFAPELVVLSRSELDALVPFADYVAAVTDAFRLHAEGHAVLPPPLEIRAESGSFHVKAGCLPLGRGYAAVKTNSNFSDNRHTRGLPTIQGAILLFDAASGSPLALLDSGEITIKRTAAATALAARHLARPDSHVATICGCGAQAPVQLTALCHALDIRRVYAVDKDAAVAKAFAANAAREHDIEVELSTNLHEAALHSDAIVTCTTSRTPLLGPDDVRPGTFIAAIGADNPEKSEIEPALMRSARVVTDSTAQCVTMGDLNHAIRAGAMRREDVHAEIGEIVVGRKPGRLAADEITIFDSSGVGILDVAASARAYELALETGSGRKIRL